MNDERSITDLQRTAERDDAIYHQWQQERGHDPNQPLTDEQWQDFYQTWSRQTEQPLDPEQERANPFTQDMQIQELDPDQTPPLSELVEENDLELDRAYVQELDAQGRIPDEPQPDLDTRLLEPSRSEQQDFHLDR